MPKNYHITFVKDQQNILNDYKKYSSVCIFADMGRIILYSILILLAYNVVFKLIIPIFRATRQVKKGFKDMQDKMNEQMNQQPGFQKTSNSTTEKKPVGDYIEFEEVKEST